MADGDNFNASVQESILTCIAFGTDDHSVFVASATDVALLDQPLNDIAAKCIAYRKRYNRAPGRQHIDDVFASVLESRDNKQQPAYHRVLTNMLRLENRLNTKFVADLVFEFNRRRSQRIAIAKAAEAYQNGKDNASEEIDEIFRKCLRETVALQRNPGFSLADPEALGFLDRSTHDFCPIQIKEFDRVGLCPTRREMLLFIAARNRGKSQFLHHCGKLGLLHGWRVVHYTLENSAEMTSMRYFQTLYGGVKRGDKHHNT